MLFFRKAGAALLLIVALGAFLRFVHFSDWLHFELDQARDAIVVGEALAGGPGELTLLGMKAGGTSLRLGPGFYYLEYLSGLIFGGSPAGLAMAVPILSVLSIAAFYLFARRIFGTGLSLGLSLLFSVSAFIVMYGRFAWNPNPIPFFALAGFYALLRSVAPGERRPGRWFVLAALMIGFSTHLHFLAFLALPAIAGLFFLLRRPRFSWKAWAGAAIAFFLFYVPVAFNEMETGGANSKAFLAAITEKSSKEEHSLPAKLIRNVTEHGLGYMVVLSGHESGGFFDIRLGGEAGIRTECDARCQYGWKEGGLSITLFLLGTLSLAFLWWKERDRKRADALLLSGLWLAVTFAVFLPLSYGFSPRFFLVSAPIPFLMIGFLAEAAARLSSRYRKAIAAVAAIVVALLAGTSLWNLSERFGQLSKAGSEAMDVPADRILKEKTRVTLEQQMAIVGWLKERSDRTGWPVYMRSEPEHQRALKYLIQREGILGGASFPSAPLYEEGIYALIIRSGSDLQDGMRKYAGQYDVSGFHPFGTLVLIELKPKPGTAAERRQDPESLLKGKGDTAALPRYTWREWLERKNDAANDSEGEED